jgi:hypothetical protein
MFQDAELFKIAHFSGWFTHLVAPFRSQNAPFQTKDSLSHALAQGACAFVTTPLLFSLSKSA